MTCGDTIIQGTCGETCDDGNLDPNDGCSPTCQLEPGLACPDTPLTGCRRPFVAQKASIVIADKSPNDAKNIFKWKWIRGERTTVGEYGDPLDDTNYQLCVYDQTGRLTQATIPAGGLCGASNPKPCWKTSGVSGFKYKDKDLTPHGVQKLVLKEGADGKAKIQLIAKGTLFPMPDLAAISQPLTIQIQNSSGLCFEAIYSVPPTKQTPAQFKDKAD
jgi:cysteine-rich repeat protein